MILASYLTCDAQNNLTYKADKGDTVLFEAAVMPIATYRLVRDYTIGATAFIDSTEKVIASYEQSQFMLDQYIMGQDKEIDLLYARIDAKDSLINEQSIAFDNLLTSREATKPKRFQKLVRPLLFVGGFVLGGVLVK